MPVVRTIHAEDLVRDEQYLLVLDTGVIQVKSELTNKIVTVINPTSSYEFQMSQAGKASRDSKIDAEVKALLESLKIPDVPEAIFLAKSALTGRADGSTLRSFLALLDRFRKDDKKPNIVQRVYMSERSYQHYVNTQIQQPYIAEEWQLSLPPEELSDGTDGLLPHDILDDGTDEYLENDAKTADAIEARKNGKG